MRRYPRTELTRFLLAVDSELSVAVEVVIIGGAAAALRYGASRPTLDVDTFSRVTWRWTPPSAIRGASS